MISSGPDAGHTLLELLLVLALLAMLLGLGMPSWSGYSQNRKVLSQVRYLQSAVLLAREAAMRSGEPLLLCPQVITGVEGECGGRFSQGFSVRSASGRVLRNYPPLDGVALWNRLGTQQVSGHVRWDARGVADRNMTFVACGRGATESWALVLNRVGRARLRKNWGHCPEWG